MLGNLYNTRSYITGRDSTYIGADVLVWCFPPHKTLLGFMMLTTRSFPCNLLVKTFIVVYDKIYIFCFK